MSAGAGWMQPRVERLTQSELAEVLRLVRATPEAPQWPESAWQAFVWQGEPESALLRALWGVRDADGELCGVLAGSLLPPVTELELVLVASAQRRQGCARLLVREWLQWALAKGAESAELEVRQGNEAALQLYQVLGFVECGLRAGYYRDPVDDAVLMRRTLP